MNTFGSIITLVGLWFATTVALVRRVFRRALLGPTLPSWTWRTDLTVAAARAAVAYAARVPDDPWINRVGRIVRAPVSTDVAKRIRIVDRRLGGRRTDEYVRLGATTDLGTLFYLHGGAYVYGNPGTHRQHVARIVDATGMGAVAPSYRLAPRHPFPAGLDDALAAYLGLLDQGVPPDRVIVSGDSAGGGLTLALLVTLRDRNLPLPAGAVLFSPYTDLAHTSYTAVTNADTDYLPPREFTRPNPYYCAAEQISNPLVSPVNADLHGLPPMLILAGGAEMILDDSIRVAANARHADVDVHLSVYEDMMHVWPAIVPWEPASVTALAEVADWVRSVLGPDRFD
ncbi:MAG: alpha/beta hydrolase [Acidimicrobiia bacterium]|nr:alpha/beta hydrolase [Acidimicrobiia bacterium]